MKKNMKIFILVLVLSQLCFVQVFAMDSSKPAVNHEDMMKVIQENKEYLDEDFIVTVTTIINLQEANPNLNAYEVQDILSNELTTRGLISEAGDVWKSLTDAEKVLVVLFPIQALLVNVAKNKTDELTNTYYLGWIDGDVGNSFRHAMWNALMTKSIGKPLAKAFADAHENQGLTDAEYKANVWHGFNGLEHRNMDLHNNQKGRDCVKWYEGLISDSTIVKRVQEKIKNGEMMILVK
ncbi:hypothetical protein HZI73_13955 [Vallitalea pronyensis]|uniref:DUF6973 domain-containing protein n=1 Tax=Vallitalea pronyensis TaxID=1348613 RepID=A0A8J8SHD9_9FIRM|nr:hypothetical protein [Vallitalea pronyensis]QUI23322.1 hypothetical protein HZI73_13955 [Vallitalea pronyensis]